MVYSCQNWNLSSTQLERLDVTYRHLLRCMIRNGFTRVDENNNDFRLQITNARLHTICGTSDLSEFVRKQQRNYCEHVIRMPLHGSLKKLLFNEDKNIKRGRQSKTLVELVLEHDNITLDSLCNRALSKKE